MSKASFVPAIGEQFNSVWNRKLKYLGKDGKEYDMKFFTDESFFKLDIALQSIYYAKNGVGKNKSENYRDIVGFPKNKILISDSAGFQLASFKKKGEQCNIRPIDSLRWQEEIADIAMNLDVPPNLDGNPSYDDFIKALDESVENFKLFEKERKNYDMKLYNVLHGETLQLANIWYDKVKDFKFEGWAIGMKPPYNPMLQALGFMFLWEKGEYKKESCFGIHFFGTSGKHVVPTIVYAASKLNNIKVTYDSSSYNIGSIFRTYYSPFDIGPVLSFGDKFKRENPNIKELPCDCPVCSKIKDINELNSTDIFAGTLISLHNLYQYHQYNKYLNSLVNDKNKFIEYLKTINISEKTLISIEFIDYAIENGLNKAIIKYEKYLLPEEIEKSKQKDIWSF
jgi:queuine/archaeosine tRNA-ribosyltransferase